MIIGGELHKGVLTLNAESSQDATMIKSGLSGKNHFINLSPYGNRINLTNQGSNLILKKHVGTSLTYEEIKVVIKKIQMFGRIKPEKADSILLSARRVLDSKLTFFFITLENPVVEIGFSYNWASIEFKSSNFDKIFPNIKDAITNNSPSSIKVFSNNSDSVSVHNYAMNGIYIPRHSFDAISDILISEGVLKDKHKDNFIIKASAFGIKSVCYMEARQIAGDQDESFTMGDSSQYKEETGDFNFVTNFYNIITSLAEHGSFSELTEKDITFLKEFTTDIDNLEKYNLSETIKECCEGLVHDYEEDIASYA